MIAQVTTANALLPVVAAVMVGAAGVTWAGVVRLQRSHAVVLRLSGPHDPVAPPPWFVTAVDMSGLTMRVDVAWRWATRVGVLAGLVMAVNHPVVAVAVAAVMMVAVRARSQLRRRADVRAEAHHLASAIDVVLFRLASGSSLVAALEQASNQPSPLAADLGRIASRVGQGVAVQVAVDDWAQRSGSVGIRLVADAVAIAGVSGGSQQAALLGVQATLRERDALAREIRALAAQARTSGVVLVITPVAFAVFVAVVDPRVAAFFASPAGWGCVAAGLVLDAVGATWMDRMAGVVE